MSWCLTAEVVAERAEGRDKVSGYGEWTVEALRRLLLSASRIGPWLDTSKQTVGETVTTILARLDDASVESGMASAAAGYRSVCDASRAGGLTVLRLARPLLPPLGGRTASPTGLMAPEP